MKEETIKIIKIEPGKKPYVKEISNRLESLQHEVDGYIEALYPFTDDVCVVCNEEGKLNHMELNRALRDDTGEIYDIVAGPFFIAGNSGANFGSVPEELIDKYTKMFECPEMFAKIGDKIHCFPLK